MWLMGFGSEPVFDYTAARFRELGAPNIIDVENIIYEDAPSIDYDGRRLRLSSACYGETILTHDDTIYHRLFLRIENLATASSILKDICDAFAAFAFDAPAGTLIVNRPGASACNSSKAGQLKILAEMGFRIPSTIVSLCREALLEFYKTHAVVICKGISGQRTIARILSQGELQSLPHLQQIPIMLQEYIPGFDVRVHCVGIESTSIKIETEFTDYRYAQDAGHHVVFTAIELPPRVWELCWRYMKRERQEFAAFDFRVDAGEWWLLEVNPMPGYSFFDVHCDKAISSNLWSLLSRGYSNHYSPQPIVPFITAQFRPQVRVGVSRR
jgi:glutathione synthase/RimK-type ligase-like ATP-grasp enzyme